MKLLSIVGARPQFVKAAVVSAAIERHNSRAKDSTRIEQKLIHTGQHYEHNLSGVFFDQLPLPTPDYHLGVGSGAHGAQTAAMLEGLEKVLLQEKPDMTVVYGDTNSTIAGALASAKMNIPVAHVEAGLRSFNRAMPEEMNRVATDHLSDLLLCPTDTAVKNLRREGILRGVALTGDVMLDAVQSFQPLAARRAELLNNLDVRPGGYALVTIHRAENTDDLKRLESLLGMLTRLGKPAVFPMHPRLRDRIAKQESGALRQLLEGARELRVIEPVSYLDMLLLETNARMILTDSGGVQKEAYFVGVPCLTLRDETEWIETLQNHWNRVVGTSPEKILPLAQSLWTRNGATPKGAPNLRQFGGGRAADRTVRAIVAYLRKGAKQSR
jgi:UDP-N-acetylglucosamine 2-epimerase